MMLLSIMSQIVECLALATLLGVAVGWVVRGQLLGGSRGAGHPRSPDDVDHVDVRVQAGASAGAANTALLQGQVQQLQGQLTRTEAKLDRLSAHQRQELSQGQHASALAAAVAQAEAVAAERDRARRLCQQHKASVLRIQAQLEVAVQALGSEQERRCRDVATIGERDGTLLVVRQELTFTKSEVSRLQHLVQELRAELRRTRVARAGSVTHRTVQTRSRSSSVESSEPRDPPRDP